jgi:hypothetical protein
MVVLVRPDPKKRVRPFVEIVNNSGQWGDEVVSEGFYDEEEYHDISTANAACGAAMYNALKDACKIFDPSNVWFSFFGVGEEATEELDYGYYMFMGSVTMRTGEVIDITVTCIPRNTEKFRIFDSNYI